MLSFCVTYRWLIAYLFEFQAKNNFIYYQTRNISMKILYCKSYCCQFAEYVSLNSVILVSFVASMGTTNDIFSVLTVKPEHLQHKNISKFGNITSCDSNFYILWHETWRTSNTCKMFLLHSNYTYETDHYILIRYQSIYYTLYLIQFCKSLYVSTYSSFHFATVTKYHL